MRKIFTLALMAAAMFTAYAAEPFYTATFNSQEEFDKWKVVDANEDEKTWTFDASGEEGKQVFYSYHGTNQANDWLISPAITPAESGRVMIRFHYRGSYYGEALQIYVGDSQTVEGMTELRGDYEDLKDNDYGSFVVIDVEAGVPFHIGFHANSQPDKWRLYLKDVTCEMAGRIVDLRAAELISPVTGENLTASETAIMKIQNIGYDDLNSFTVSLIVDGEKVLEEPVTSCMTVGGEINYTFKGKVDLSKPRHLYEIKAAVTCQDDVELSNDTVVAYVRHIAPATVPYSTGFEPTEYNDGHKSFNLNEDSGNWGVEVGSMWFNMARTGLGFIGYNYDKTNSADDWFIMEPINVEEGYYVFRFWYSGDDNHPEKLALYWGNEQTPEAMTNKVVEYAPFQRGAYDESINILYFDKPQTVFFGFYAFSDKDENWITIDDVTMDKIEATDVDFKVLSLSNPTDYVPTLSSKDVSVVIKNYGITEKPVEVILSIDGEEVAQSHVTFVAQEEKKVTFENALASLAKGTHAIKVVVVCDGDIDDTNNSIEKEIRVLGDPDIFYGFEDGTIPVDFQFADSNDATLAPGAIEEFGETGWTIINIVEHEYLGSHVLAGSTYMNDDATPSRYCILPRLKVESEDACFLWSAGATSPYFTESYQIKGSDSSDPFYYGWYDRLTTINSEFNAVFNRGVSLKRYNGKEIYLAIELISPNGDAAMFDNLSIYGCSISENGVKTIAADSMDNVAVTGDYISLINGEKAQIRVYDMSGRNVMSVVGSNASLSSLARGVYVVKVATANGVITKKVAK